MKDLIKITNAEGREVTVIDSREVAEMLGKKHEDIMKAIKGSGKNLGLIPILTKGNFPVVNYFIESTYIDTKGEARRCYLCTKMGCELLGNKQQGEKGILFTAKYVERFNQMERTLKEQSMDSYMIEDPYARALRWAEEYKERMLLQEEVKVTRPKAEYYDEVLSTKGDMTVTEIAKAFDMTAKKLNKYLLDKKIIFKQGKDYFPYKEYDGKGYTSRRTWINKYNNTSEHYLVWTEKGKRFIYNLLIEDGLIKKWFILKINLKI